MKKIFVVFLALVGLLSLAGCNKSNPDRDVYINVCQKVLDTINNKSDVKLNDYVVSDDDYVKDDDVNGLMPVRCMIYFIELLYKNESFPISDNAVSFRSDYVKNGVILQYNEQSFKASLDKENNKVIISLIGYSSFDENYKDGIKAYLHLDVDFNFNSNEITAYSLFVGDLGNFMYEVYKDGEVYSLDRTKTEANNQIAKEYENDFNNLEAESVNLESIGDFSFEYTKATDDILGNDYFE